MDQKQNFKEKMAANMLPRKGSTGEQCACSGRKSKKKKKHKHTHRDRSPKKTADRLSLEIGENLKQGSDDCDSDGQEDGRANTADGGLTRPKRKDSLNLNISSSPLFPLHHGTIDICFKSLSIESPTKNKKKYSPVSMTSSKNKKKDTQGRSNSLPPIKLFGITNSGKSTSLRWEHELEDPDAEMERIKKYKLNRRKRYLVAAKKKYSDWVTASSSTSSLASPILSSNSPGLEPKDAFSPSVLQSNSSPVLVVPSINHHAPAAARTEMIVHCN